MLPILCLQAKVQPRQCHGVVRVAGALHQISPGIHQSRYFGHHAAFGFTYAFAPDRGGGLWHIPYLPTADFRKDSGKAPCLDPATVTLEHAVPFAKFLG